MPARTVEPHEGMTYDSLRERFAWRMPERFNLGAACADAHDPDRVALVAVDRAGAVRTLSFGELAGRYFQVANIVSCSPILNAAHSTCIVSYHPSDSAHCGTSRIGREKKAIRF